MHETAVEIANAHRTGAATPAETVARSYERIRACGDPAIFISLRDEKDALGEASRLSSAQGDLPLLGVPVAVKDNIDVAGLPTTAACKAFSYQPSSDATAVARLRKAGAVVIGKTNLDQFATGLVGVRSPYGVPKNPFKAEMIPGGSSSGSAVAVSAGLVPLALGTDTAGSGRVPAGLNNIVGIKPSLGLVSTTGVVPACRSLDCVSVFALTAGDAFTALSVMAGHDESDPYSRRMTLPRLGRVPPAVRIAIPRPADRHFFGDSHAETSFAKATELLRSQGANVVEIEMTEFLDAARLLYEGPWLAERWVAVGDFITKHPSDIHPVTKQIVDAGAKPSAADAFRAFYRLAELRSKAMASLAPFDALMVPTAPAAYTVAQVEADPIRLNSNLGTYTNFVNLFDLAGIAVPVSLESNGMPYGVTLLSSAGRDAFLASLGNALHAATGLTLGHSGRGSVPSLTPESDPGPDEIGIAVVGAHLSGMPLNGELRTLGARFLEAATTARHYRLFALANTRPPKPGMLRVAANSGCAIELEVWALSPQAFGRFVAQIPSPLSVGTIELANGKSVHGFLVEADAVRDARDISAFGGWRNFVAQDKLTA